MKGWKWAKWSAPIAVLLSVIMLAAATPVYATSTFVSLQGVYTVTCNLPELAIDGTRPVTRAKNGTLTITTESATTGIISSATLAITGVGSVAVTGYGGAGANPNVYLVGSAGGIAVVFKGKARTSESTVTAISGNIDGFLQSSDATYNAGGGTSALDVTAQNSGAVSAKLTAAAGAGSVNVQWVPQGGIQLKDISRIDTDKWGLWFNQQVSTQGKPQLELRFTANSTVTDGAGHVDVTLLAPHTGLGTWEHETYDQTSTCQYYGNSPVNGTAFDGGGNIALSTAVAAINDEAVMAGSDASHWKLSRVTVELWDAGVRTCYVDDVMINGKVNGFEPARFSGRVSAKPAS